MYYFSLSTITIGKIKEIVEKGYFLEGGAREPGPKLCQSWITMKPWYTMTSLLLACSCLHIWPWLIFCCTSKRDCIS
jgi:hypothetical protein